MKQSQKVFHPYGLVKISTTGMEPFRFALQDWDEELNGQNLCDNHIGMLILKVAVL